MCSEVGWFFLFVFLNSVLLFSFLKKCLEKFLPHLSFSANNKYFFGNIVDIYLTMVVVTFFQFFSLEGEQKGEDRHQTDSINSMTNGFVRARVCV